MDIDESKLKNKFVVKKGTVAVLDESMNKIFYLIIAFRVHDS